MRKKNKKYFAVFVVKEKGTYSYSGVKKLSSTSKSVKYKKGTYLVDIEHYTFSRGLKLFYYIDIAGTQLKVVDKKKTNDKSLGLEISHYDPEVLDLIISKNIVTQLTANLSDNAIKLNIITLVIGGVMGALLGYIIAGVI